jgi:hypothetical protein
MILVLLEAGSVQGGYILHVPISWCAVVGSPAQAAPNVNGDTTTNDVLWRRHERPTDDIYLPQAKMSFRSGITHAGLDHGTLSFPIISAPTPPAGPFNTGDVAFYEGDFGAVAPEVREDINELLHSCRDAWQELGIEAQGIDPTQALGITAININMFRDLNGAVPLLGYAVCETDIGGSFMDCVEPLDSYVVISDNSYMYPGHANNAFVLTDPKDIVFGHELGHALGLLHRQQNQQLPADPMALMNECPTDGVNPNCASTALGVANNTLLDPSEIITLRENAAKANGLEIDPPSVFIPGSWVAGRRMDLIKEIDPPATPFPRRHQDMVSVLLGLDTQTDLLTLKQELLGLIPTEGGGQEHWWLLDTDNDLSTGADPSLLPLLIGSPRTTFEGTDLAVRVQVADAIAFSDTVWEFVNGAFVQLPPSVHSSRLTSMILRGIPPPGVPLNPVFEEVPLNHFVRTEILNNRLRIPIALDQPICIQSMTADPEDGQERNPVDELDSEGLGCGMILRIPEFPHCFPQTPGVPAGTVETIVDGLMPSAGFHALVGADLVLNGVADSGGNATIDLPIPADAVPGPHLVTIGTDGTALTADCTVFVTPFEIDHFSVYQAAGPTPPASFQTVTLSDQFNDEVVSLGALELFMVPADKNGEGLSDPISHLACNPILDGNPDNPEVTVTNQFGEARLAVGAPRELCVPTENLLTPGPVGIDHFKCYEVSGEPVDAVATLVDQFQEWGGLALDPFLLCNPVDKNGEGIQNFDDHLVCYSVSPTGQSLGIAVPIANQIYPDVRIDVFDPTALCVPSTKELPEPGVLLSLGSGLVLLIWLDQRRRTSRS